MKPLDWSRHRSIGDHSPSTIESYPYVIHKLRRRFKLHKHLPGCEQRYLGTFTSAAAAKAEAQRHSEGKP